MPALPLRPSREHLRKEAKRLARSSSLQLADAQRRLANDYGFPTWSALMRHAGAGDIVCGASALFVAVRASDVATARRLIAEGANPRLGDGRESLLHAAARYGPLAMVEMLIEAGVPDWQTDAAGHQPLDVARRSRARDRRAIIALLDRDADADPSFRAAINAIHTGDTARLARLLDAEPRLMHERILGPQAYRAAQRPGYFRDPKLFWYVANNPKLMERMPSNIVEIAQTMIDRGVERIDLDYTLELVMTSSGAREQGHQAALVQTLRAAGAIPSRTAIVNAAAHGERDMLRTLIAEGEPLAILRAAALGEDAIVRERLATASANDIQMAFALAVINREVLCARIALDAGADINAFLPVHEHSTALHQAAVNDDVAMIDLLLAREAQLDVRDTLWGGIPLDWAIHEHREAARIRLERETRGTLAR
jgi:ankyrin repeat protein